MRVFHDEPGNVWVTQMPYVWLPTVLVPAALAGHLLIFRRLGFTSLGSAPAPP